MSKKINISWWNTGLVPPVQSEINKPINADKAEKMKSVVFHLIEHQCVDILILAEISAKCSDLLKEVAEKINMKLVLATEKVGRINFDIALFYKEKKLEYLEKENLIPETSAGKKIRCGTRFLLREKITYETLTIFASHWPSQKNAPKHRTVFGQKLREHVNFILNKDVDNIILVGDYNDQPFSSSIIDGIEATKDIDIVKKKRKLLYNPFWRHLDKHSEEHTFSGSYFHKGNIFDKWYTYDQMMFSSSFIGDTPGKWRLDINSACFHYNTISKDEIGFDFLTFFDHVPIYSRILKHE